MITQCGARNQSYFSKKLDDFAFFMKLKLAFFMPAGRSRDAKIDAQVPNRIFEADFYPKG